jgi:hypothetical protein
MLTLSQDQLESYIKTIGLFRTKAKNLLATCRILVEQYGGEVPRDREALESLPGVGRKTANVILNTAFGEETIAVDTHIFRVANRTGIAPGADCARGGGQTAQGGAGAIPQERAPLADSARALCLQGAQARLSDLHHSRSMRISQQDARPRTSEGPKQAKPVKAKRRA